MPLISSKGLYGLAAMYELLQHDKKEPMQIKQISKKADIPQNYLEQLLSKLRHASLVKSVRGSQGGYLLAVNPKNILIKDILTILEDDIKVTHNKSNSPVLNLFFDETNDKIQQIFNLSLHDLKKYQKTYNQYLHYNI